jgi:hypothetical protein
MFFQNTGCALPGNTGLFFGGMQGFEFKQKDPVIIELIDSLQSKVPSKIPSNPSSCLSNISRHNCSLKALSI